MDLYGHLVPEASGRARDALDNAFRLDAHVPRKCPRRSPTLPKRISKPWAAGESACRPGSVHPLARAGGHPSGTAVAGSLVRSTREHRAGHPQTFAQEAGASLLTLLRVGFTEPPGSLRALVVSYTTTGHSPTWDNEHSRCPRSGDGPSYRREVSSVTMSAAGCGCLASVTPCPAHIESASMSPVVPVIGGAARNGRSLRRRRSAR